MTAAEDREREAQEQESLTHEDGIEAAAEALCAWPSVKVDDREHNTATHMATDAIAAYLSHVSAPFSRGHNTSAQYVIWINADRTVMVRRWESGAMEVAVRDDPGDVWGPPVQVEPERAA